MLTVLIPTYNRYSLLEKCVKSVKDTIQDAHIIVGDSNLNKDHALIDDLKLKYEIQYLDLSQHECDLHNIFLALVESANTEYVLIVEDDDVLCNEGLHSKISDMLQSHVFDFISFSSCLQNGSSVRFMNKDIDMSDEQHIPDSWNGEFQFGMMYFRRSILLDSFKIWFNEHPERTFDGSFDEALALIAIHNSRKCIHMNEVGMKIGVGDDNVSWSKLISSMYASRDYIQTLQQMLNMNISWKNRYQQIQFRELQTMSDDIRFNDVFNNKFFFSVASKIKSLLDKGNSPKDVKYKLSSMLNEYQTMKNWHLNEHSCTYKSF